MRLKSNQCGIVFAGKLTYTMIVATKIYLGGSIMGKFNLNEQIAFLRKVQTTVDDLTSYTTDALSVTHGDKPYANLQQTISDLESMRRTIWYKMARYHLL